MGNKLRDLLNPSNEDRQKEREELYKWWMKKIPEGCCYTCKNCVHTNELTMSTHCKFDNHVIFDTNQKPSSDCYEAHYYLGDNKYER